jgi:hypothetical protein
MKSKTSMKSSSEEQVLSKTTVVIILSIVNAILLVTAYLTDTLN